MLRAILLLLGFLVSHPSDAATKTAVPLRVAYSSISGAGIVTWIALDKGLFAKYDLDVELIYVAGSQAMQSLLSGTLQPYPEPSLSTRAARWVKGAITLTGLVLVIVTRGSDAGGYAIGGWVIWGGAIACYFASGIIAREVGGIPLSMGYGGWKVRRDRNGKIRR